MANTWKFVDLPVASPATLLDMNDGVSFKTLGGDDFKLPSPPLKRSITANAMSDGGVVTSAAYDLRTLTFMVDLLGATDTARIAQLDALKAQLAKPTNLVMHQLQTATFPVFFRTLRSDDYIVDTEISTGFWRVSCSILAEPFAIGIRRDLPTVTVTNDPAAGTNRTLWDITGIVGDSPTPAFVRLQGLGAAGSAFLSQRTANNPTALTLFGQAESATLGTDTTTWSNAVMSGGAGTATSFANANLVTRLTFNLPSASLSTALRGRYRVMLRVHTGGTSANFVLRWAQNPTGDAIFGPQVSYHANTVWQFVDLGVIEFPSLPAPRSIGYSGLDAGYATGQLAIQASRSGGLDNLDIDYVYLMPCDERWCSFGQSTAASFLVLDGPNDAAYGMAAGSTPFGATRTVDNAGGLTSKFGGLPMLVPGTTNRWFLLVDKQDVTTTKTVDVSYWPRWREVATS